MSSTVISLLEDTLKKAKEHGFASVAVLVTGPNGNYYNWTYGEETQQLELVSSFHDRLRAHVDNWRPNVGDDALDESYAAYNCSLVPDGFDFLTWLITQEIHRIDENAPGPLKVAFWRGRKPQPNLWLDMVYRPMIKMIGAVEDDKALGRMGAEVFVTRTMAGLYRAGAKLPKLSAIGHYGWPTDCITITLRECDNFPHRNSDLLLWYEFSKWLKLRGENVVFVRDTSKSHEPMFNCETFPLASKDLDARMSLYEHARLNYFVSNGPMMLAALTEHIPYITFVQPEEMDSKYDANKPIFWKIKMGVEMGEQFPWANEKQRIVWEKPTLDSLMKSYIRFTASEQKRVA